MGGGKKTVARGGEQFPPSGQRRSATSSPPLENGEVNLCCDPPAFSSDSRVDAVGVGKREVFQSWGEVLGTAGSPRVDDP